MTKRSKSPFEDETFAYIVQYCEKFCLELVSLKFNYHNLQGICIVEG